MTQPKREKVFNSEDDAMATVEYETNKLLSSERIRHIDYRSGKIRKLRGTHDQDVNDIHGEED